MTPFFADAIDFPLVFVAGLIVLVPLMAFEVCVEALVLKGIWRLPYAQLCRFTLTANILSLLAGIPIAILNVAIDAWLLPEDIPGFFARYPFAAALGTLTYFTVTLLVEGAYAFDWRRRNKPGLPASLVWRGVLLANIATYAALAPLHYYATKPGNQIREFTNDTRWATPGSATVLFIDATDRFLKSVRLDGTERKTLVPLPFKDYLVSPDLKMCVFRGVDGSLYFYRGVAGQTNLLWKTDERLFMNAVAFSPSGEIVAFASQEANSITVVDVTTGRRTGLPLVPKFTFDGASVAWSSQETNLFIRGFEGNVRLQITIEADGTLTAVPLEGTNAPPVLKCYEPAGDARWSSGGDWGITHGKDTCADLSALAWQGLDSGLLIQRENGPSKSTVLTVSVRPGLLHLARFGFDDVGFVEGCRDCLFEANGYIYLLDISERRLGTLAKGSHFIQLTPRYEKRF